MSKVIVTIDSTRSDIKAEFNKALVKTGIKYLKRFCDEYQPKLPYYPMDRYLNGYTNAEEYRDIAIKFINESAD